MIDRSLLLTNRADELRRDFDASFALPALSDPPQQELLIAVRVAGDPYAIRTNDLAGLVRQPHITRLPTRIHEVMGLASIRGMLTPVYRLGSFLGYHADRSQPRWLALHGSGESVGLAFDAFEGQIAVSDSEVYSPLENESGREHVTGAVRVGDLQRAVIDLDSIVQAIRRRALESTPSKEQ